MLAVRRKLNPAAQYVEECCDAVELDYSEFNGLSMQEENGMIVLEICHTHNNRSVATTSSCHEIGSILAHVFADRERRQHEWQQDSN